jgi:hypothetical protein
VRSRLCSPIACCRLLIYGRCFQQAGKRAPRLGLLRALSKAECRSADLAPPGQSAFSTIYAVRKSPRLPSPASGAGERKKGCRRRSLRRQFEIETESPREPFAIVRIGVLAMGNPALANVSCRTISKAGIHDSVYVTSGHRRRYICAQ